jgi:hypothetical protein
MIRKLLAVSLTATASVPAIALAGTSSNDTHSSASKQCTAVQAKLGATSFDRAFVSFGACVSALTPLARQSANTTAAACRNERASASFAAIHGGKTFAQFYGVGRTHKNAYGKCVSAKAQTALVTTVSAASACQTAQANANFASSHGGKTFAQFYGTSAFAMCLALKAQSSLTLSSDQPTQAPAQQESKGSTPVGGCGPVEAGGGPAHPLVASCTVAKSN